MLFLVLICDDGIDLDSKFAPDGSILTLNSSEVRIEQ